MRLNTDCATLVEPPLEGGTRPAYANTTSVVPLGATSFMAIEHAMLELLAANAPLTQVLAPLVRGYEALFPGLRCVVATVGADDPLPRCIAGSVLGTVCESLPIFDNQNAPLGQLDISCASADLWAGEAQKAAKRIAYLAGLALAREHRNQQTKTEQTSLQEAARHHRNILDNMLDGVITVNKHGLIESVNKSVCAIFGYDADEMLGINIAVLMPEPSDPEGGHQARQLQSLHNSGSNYLVGKPRETMGQRKDGGIFPMSLSVSKIARKGQPTFVIVVRDITQRRQSEEEIHRLAFYDPLTELPNRRLLIDRLKQATVTSARTGQYGAVMFLDLDQFKLLNDTQGHAMGDELLKQVATRLKTCVRLGDSVARLGGDEFVVLLERLSDSTLESAAFAEMVAGKILAVLGQPYKLRGQIGRAHD